MRLLIITQKVDQRDPILGFFHLWIEHFSLYCDKVTVICLQKGEYSFGPNVRVLSLGKERGSGRLIYFLRFYKYLWQERKNYDKVFVHMNPIYIVLVGWWWRLSSKPVFLWYTHRQVDLKLRLAEKFVQKIFTVSEETFRLSSPKVSFVGHGIPLDLFEKPQSYKREDDHFRLVSVGRITPIKNLETLIMAASLLSDKINKLEVLIVGTPTQKGDDLYFEKLKELVEDNSLASTVSFVGSVPNSKIREYYWESDVSINLCPTGGVDKVVLESMASGLPVLVSNRAFKPYLGMHQDKLLFKEKDEGDLAQKILGLTSSQERSVIGDYLLKMSREKAGLDRLIKKIISLV